MRNNYTNKFKMLFVLLALFSINAFAQDETPMKKIALIGSGPIGDAASYDSLLIDSLAQYLDVIYLNAAEFNNASADSLYNVLGLEGIVISESIGSGDIINFGPARDNFPVPSISLEAGAYTNSWGDASFLNAETGGIWGYGGADAQDVDLQWKMVDVAHEVTLPLGYSEGQIVTLSTADPTTRGVPYLHGTETITNVLGVAARTDGGGNADFVQDLAIAFAEFPVQQSLFMNLARAYHDVDATTGQPLITQDFLNLLRQSCYYMFDAYPEQPLANENIIKSIINLDIYPNPVASEMNIEFVAKANSKSIITLMSLSGQALKSTELTTQAGENTVKMNVSEFNAGIYLVKMNLDGKESFKRVVLK